MDKVAAPADTGLRREPVLIFISRRVILERSNVRLAP